MPRVLVFGDCGDATELLAGSGYEVLRAPGKSRALGLAKDLLPELVLVGAAEEPGHAEQIVRWLASDPVTRLLPTLLVLGEPDAAHVRNGLEAGASDVVSLRTAPAELLARAAAALREKRVLEDLIAERQRATLLELAGAVAHKINQPLTSMSIIVETLIVAHGRADLSPERLAAKLADLQRLVDRMAAIVKQVGGLIDYRTIDYVGDVKIIDLEPVEDPDKR